MQRSRIEILKKNKIKLIKEVATKKEAEKKAIHSHNELLYVLNSLTKAVYYCKSDGEVMFMNHKALKLLSPHDSVLATTEKQQYINHIVRFNEENNISNESLDIAGLANSSKFISNLNAYHVSSDGQAQLTPVELTIIPTKQYSATLEPNFIIVVEDISSEVKLKEMSYLVSHDYLTKLHNRMYIIEQIEIALVDDSTDYSLAIIDLDKFKAVNDSCGHCAGDQLLKLVAKTIPKSLGHNDLLARIGGDEFAVLFNSNQEDSAEKSSKIIADLEGLNFTYNGNLMPISCSIGITKLRASDKKVVTVMMRADKACYQVKRNGRGSVEIYKNKVANIQEFQVV